MTHLNELLDRIDALKEKLDARRPLTGTERHQLREYYRIGLTYASNALEGNTLNEIETRVVLEDGITIGGKPLKDHLEAAGHSDAYDFMYQLVKNEDIVEADILRMHHLFYHRIDEAHAGKYRGVKVLITGSAFTLPRPGEIPDRMKHFIDELPEMRHNIHPVLYAASVHLKFVQIHPFIDGNGRIARLLMNLELLKRGYPVAIIPPMIRADYFQAIESGNKNDGIPFKELIAGVVLEAQKEYMRLLA
jgi:Fic family protein